MEDDTSLAGGVGIVLTIPLTAWLSHLIFRPSPKCAPQRHTDKETQAIEGNKIISKVVGN
ncbi:hypothetical protein [Ferrimonas kyonanensis]|uniref:hypothetical protein n=1 Tax=Ferrimonas kyonanensis TaxID=364763 RepID=UPI00040501E8|nr:hypothetical protein [Ferrimonas kyonanensis]